jgi:TatD DNase family protein
MQRNRKFPAEACPCCVYLPNDSFLPLNSSSLASGTDVDTTEIQTITAHSEMLSISESWDLLQQQSDPLQPILFVDTHGHAHLQKQQLESDDTTSLYHVTTTTGNGCDDRVVSVTCAVSPNDWFSCLDYAAQSALRIPALGIHPWYLDDLYDTWLEDLEALIQQHAGCLIGEIGLCKQARFLRTYEGGKQAALELQRSVFRRQLELAGTYQRAASVHCVNDQATLLSILADMTVLSLPPAIALHSFTGTEHHIQQLLKWEATLQLSSPLLYFGFSHAINCDMSTSVKSRRQNIAAIQSVPLDRLLAESDVHATQNVAGGTAGAIAYICFALNSDQNDSQLISLQRVAELTTQNALRFLQRSDDASIKD